MVILDGQEVGRVVHGFVINNLIVSLDTYQMTRYIHIISNGQCAHRKDY